MYPRYKVKCPRCGKDLEFPLTPDIIKQATEMRDGMARVAIPHEDHVLIIQVDRWGTVRNTVVSFMVEEAFEDCEVVEGNAPKAVERQLQAIARRGGPQNDSERILWEYAKKSGYLICR